MVLVFPDIAQLFRDIFPALCQSYTCRTLLRFAHQYAEKRGLVMLPERR